jgi:hypothetical protein
MIFFDRTVDGDAKGNGVVGGGGGSGEKGVAEGRRG